MEDNEILVLLAEDDPANQTVIMKMLSFLNMKVELAADGREAVSMCKEKKYHIIFMDLLMPVMSGVTATIEIRNANNNRNQDTPIIALTALVSSEDEKQCFEAGMNEYLTKPIDFPLLKQIAQKYRI